MFSLPRATQALLLANVLIFLLQNSGLNLEQDFALWPLAGMLGEPGFRPWQVVTYAFLHASWAHLIFNMFALYMFGGDVERVWGEVRFVKFYFVCVVSAAIAQLLVAPSLGSYGPTIGASGGVFGLLLAFGMMFPNRRIMLLIPPIPMPAWVFVTGYGVLELILGVAQTGGGVAHFAHLGGMLGGYLMIKFGNRRWKR